MPWDVRLGHGNLTSVIHEKGLRKMKLGIDIPVGVYYDRDTNKLSFDDK
jgi:hypothetical protein